MSDLDELDLAQRENLASVCLDCCLEFVIRIITLSNVKNSKESLFYLVEMKVTFNKTDIQTYLKLNMFGYGLYPS